MPRYYITRTWHVVLVIIFPIILERVLRFRLFGMHYAKASILGVLLVGYFTVQMIFSVLNTKEVIYKSSQADLYDTISSAVGISVVGYKEDKDIFKKCLLSIKNINCNSVVVVIDGNEDDEDFIMKDIFCEVFPGSTVVEFERTQSDNNAWQPNIHNAINSLSQPAILVLQPHRGKRHAMYTSFKILGELMCCSYIFTTDSDTIVDKYAVQHLLSTIMQDKDVSAVAGQVKIWNVNTMFTFISSLRHWFASNLERAAQSYRGCVGCVPGPIGMYKYVDIKEYMNRWVFQKFIGKYCHYGDDRHLTNIILRQGKRVKYNQLAVCYTETPSTVSRWVQQQTRWNKSAIRESFWSVGAFYKQDLWLFIDIVHQSMYYLVVICTIVYILMSRKMIDVVIWLYTVFAMSFTRSIYATLITKDTQYMFFPAYVVIYILLSLPAKLFSFVTLYDAGWGTSARGLKDNTNGRFSALFPVLIWDFAIMSRLIYILIIDWAWIMGNTHCFIPLIIIIIVLAIVYFTHSNNSKYMHQIEQQCIQS